MVHVRCEHNTEKIALLRSRISASFAVSLRTHCRSTKTLPIETNRSSLKIQRTLRHAAITASLICQTWGAVWRRPRPSCRLGVACARPSFLPPSSDGHPASTLSTLSPLSVADALPLLCNLSAVALVSATVLSWLRRTLPVRLWAAALINQFKIHSVNCWVVWKLMSRSGSPTGRLGITAGSVTCRQPAHHGSVLGMLERFSTERVIRASMLVPTQCTVSDTEEYALQSTDLCVCNFC